MLKLAYRIIDLLLPIVALLCSVALFEIAMPLQPYLYLALLGSLLMGVMNELRGAYHKTSFNRTLARQLELTFESWVAVVLTIIVYLYLTGDSHLASRRALVIWFVLTPLLVVLLKLFITSLHLKKSKPMKILCVGDPIFLTEFEQKRIGSNNIQLYCTDSVYCSKNPESVDSIIFNYTTPPSIEEIKELTHLELSGIKLISANHFYERYLRKCHIPYDISNIEFMNDIKKLRKKNLIFKKVFDLSAVLILGSLTLPILLFSITKIKRESPGSVLFRQERVGRMLRPFNVIKFRSMHENSKFNPYTQAKDIRIFPYGSLMRKMRIDELPQLWNVMKGDMHFIGPRAEWTILVDNYEREIPYYHERHLVKPGITGWAQVMYPYGSNTEDARQKLMYDLYYIKHWSIWLEIETTIRTIGIVLGKKGL